MESISDADRVVFRSFNLSTGESDLQLVISLIEKELSEPYPIYTYRYFVHLWPEHTFLAFLDGKCIGCIVSKLENHSKRGSYDRKRGYIAMLAVHPEHRRLGLGRKLVAKSIERMREQQADEVILETEITNQAALKLYESFGFIRDKRLAQYYLNGNDAYKLKLYLSQPYMD